MRRKEKKRTERKEKRRTERKRKERQGKQRFASLMILSCLVLSLLRHLLGKEVASRKSGALQTQAAAAAAAAAAAGSSGKNALVYALCVCRAQQHMSIACHALHLDDFIYNQIDSSAAIVRGIMDAWASEPAYALEIGKAFGGHLWASELAYAQDMVSRDVRNNSAWNQRAFLLRHKLEAEMGEWNVLSPEQQRQQAHPLSAMLAAELEYVAAQVIAQAGAQWRGELGVVENWEGKGKEGLHSCTCLRGQLS
eukprot:1158509-Pelagomonas_calceolata.AAC.10